MVGVSEIRRYKNEKAPLNIDWSRPISNLGSSGASLFKSRELAVQNHVGTATPTCLTVLYNIVLCLGFNAFFVDEFITFYHFLK